MKAKLEFDLEDVEDERSLKRALKANDYELALYEMQQKVFRPARKHGYGDASIQKILDENPACAELVEKLEQLFYDILEDYEINLD